VLHPLQSPRRTRREPPGGPRARTPNARGSVTGDAPNTGAGSRGVRYTAEALGKSFSGAVVLRAVTVAFEPGEIHSIVGENGAGKSTLLKIMAGVYQPDTGELRLGDERIRSLTPRSAQQRGIYLVPQEPTLMQHLSAAENLFLGILPRGALPFSVSWKEMRRRAGAYLARVGLDIDPETPAAELSIAQQQLLECARALVRRCDVIFFDEPTSPLTDHDAEILFEVMRSLREQRYALGFISHRLDEVFAISDRVTVLRDGSLVTSEPRRRLDRTAIVNAMVGREINRTAARRRSTVTGGPVLEVKGLTAEPYFEDVDLLVRAGEVVGVAGLVGSGRTEIAEAIFGLRRTSRGHVLLDGRPFEHRSPRACIDAGLVYLSEDRGRHGIFADVDLARNVTSSILPRLPRRLRLLRPGEERKLAESAVAQANVRARSLASRVKTLSGGNQQRAMFARWLLADPKVAILDEPTRGVDIGAKADIYDIIDRLAEAGLATLLISSEIEELLHVCDRVVVIYEGRVAGGIEGADLTAARLGALVVGEHGGKHS
jgi:ABC-type sugar transport system ATPase subunit